MLTGEGLRDRSSRLLAQTPTILVLTRQYNHLKTTQVIRFVIFSANPKVEL
ncbi:hypothetical protein [Dapis sp. BLCC M229]|uniref:hypothetical protein n=1 Tax=Dapis sp. BLCC M229 TaxID=3400188 RepID=UPI003CF82B6F